MKSHPTSQSTQMNNTLLKVCLICLIFLQSSILASTEHKKSKRTSMDMTGNEFYAEKVPTVAVMPQYTVNENDKATYKGSKGTQMPIISTVTLYQAKAGKDKAKNIILVEGKDAVNLFAEELNNVAFIVCLDAAFLDTKALFNLPVNAPVFVVNKTNCKKIRDHCLNDKHETIPSKGLRLHYKTYGSANYNRTKSNLNTLNRNGNIIATSLGVVATSADVLKSALLVVTDLSECTSRIKLIIFIVGDGRYVEDIKREALDQMDYQPRNNAVKAAILAAQLGSEHDPCTVISVINGVYYQHPEITNKDKAKKTLKSIGVYNTDADVTTETVSNDDAENFIKNLALDQKKVDAVENCLNFTETTPCNVDAIKNLRTMDFQYTASYGGIEGYESLIKSMANLSNTNPIRLKTWQTADHNEYLRSNYGSLSVELVGIPSLTTSLVLLFVSIVLVGLFYLYIDYIFIPLVKIKE